MKTFEERLLSTPVGEWKVGHVYSYDWYDGPREGACSLLEPSCEFYFGLLDERYNPEGLDDRLFRLSELPAGSVAALQAIHDRLASLDPPARHEAERRMDSVTAQKRPTSLVIHSQGMEQILGCWDVPCRQEAIADWFAFLSIPPVQPTSAD